MLTEVKKNLTNILLVLSLIITTSSALASENSVVIANFQKPRHFNGAIQSGLSTALPSTQIFASLIRFTDWLPEPYLAKSWDISDDGLSVTFNLVRNAVFHDGVPITSEDVAFSIETIKANHPFHSMFEPVTRIDTPDKHTVVLNLKHAHPALLLALSPALAPILPKHIYGDGQDIMTHPANVKPIGSGPYIYDEASTQETIVLRKNPHFFIDGRPHLDKIEIRYIKDPEKLMRELELGNIDINPFMATSAQIKRAQKINFLRVTDRGYSAVGPINWLAYNTQSPKLSDVRVRQAIAYAIDRHYITKVLHKDVSTPQFGPIIKDSPYFDPTIQTYKYNLDQARKLLAEAGKSQGLTLSIDYIPNMAEQQKNVAEYIAAQLEKIGIAATVTTSSDFPEWAKKVSEHNFELTTDVVFNWGDPVIGVHRTYASNNIRKGIIWSNTQQYSNPTIDGLLDSAAQELNDRKRSEIYAKFQHLVARDLPIYWLNIVPYHTAYNKNLRYAPLDSWGIMHPLDNLQWRK